jgi:hypothetical protein
VKIITPKILQVFSRCPHAGQLALQNNPEVLNHSNLSVRNQIVTEVIKNIYSYKARTGTRASWGWIKSWVDIRYRKHLTTISYQDYSKALEVLDILHQWYTGTYKPLGCPEGYINFPIEQAACSRIKLSIPIEVLTVEDNKVVLTEFNEETQPLKHSLLNPFVMSKIWAVKEVLGANSLSCDIITIKPRSISSKRIDLEDTHINIAIQMTTDLIKRICQGVSYPLPADHCNICMYNSSKCIKLGE